VATVKISEFRQGLPVVMAITGGTIVGGLSLSTVVMIIIGFQEAPLHYMLAVIFPVVITPFAAFPLVIMSQRLQRMRNELEGLLRLDGLTEIPNRRAFFERATAVLSHDSAATAMMIDVDHFKKVNDEHGHAVGDVVLSTVGHMIERIVTAAPQGGARIAARIGGEEFAVLIENIGPKEGQALAQNIVERVRAVPVVVGDLAIPVTVSVGVAARRSEGSPDELLRVADRACYRAKRLGRDRCCDAEPGDRTRNDTAPLAPVRRFATA